jgi:hypothetical protein
MIDYISEKKLSIYEFKTPFYSDLRADNRWVEMASIVPWDTIANLYVSSMDAKQGRPRISPRIVRGGINNQAQREFE